jgi:hypothetical protein
VIYSLQVAVGVMLAVTIFLIAYIKRLKYKLNMTGYDLSGIEYNPPKFVDLIKNKTINFVCGKEKIVISQINITQGLSIIELIARMFRGLQEQMNLNYDNKVQEVQHNILKWKYYKQICNLVFKLSKPFAKNKRRFKKEFFKKANYDMEWMLLIVEQILDYWGYLGEFVALLARGATIKQIHGEAVGWSSFNGASGGTFEIKPRLGLHLSSLQKRTEEHETN